MIDHIHLQPPLWVQTLSNGTVTAALAYGHFEQTLALVGPAGEIARACWGFDDAGEHERHDNRLREQLRRLGFVTDRGEAP